MGKNVPVHPNGVQEQPTYTEKNYKNAICGNKERYKNKSIYALLQCLQGLPWTSQVQSSQAKEVGLPRPIAFHHEQLEPR